MNERASSSLPTAVAPSTLQWDENGYILLPAVLSSRRARELRHICADLQDSRQTDSTVSLTANAAQRHPMIAALVDLPETLRLVVSVLGPFVHVLASEIWVRKPGAKSLGWHRDGGPLMRHLQQIVQVKVQFFLTSTDHRVDSANLVLLPGSHKMELPQGGISEAELRGAKTMRSNSGDSVIWAGNTWHSVRPNAHRFSRVSVTSVRL